MSGCLASIRLFLVTFSLPLSFFVSSVFLTYLLFSFLSTIIIIIIIITIIPQEDFIDGCRLNAISILDLLNICILF